MKRRNIDPARRSLPFVEWPEIDKELWQCATRKRSLFGTEGKGADWRPQTRRTNIQNYGRFLGYLAWSGQLDVEQRPAERATPEAVEAYFDHIAPIMAPASQLSLLVGLKVTLQAMHPELSWRWLQDACNRLQSIVAARRQERSDLPSIIQLDRLARRELADAQKALGEGCPTPKAATRFRDALQLALLIRRPLRTFNFSNLRIGAELIPAGSSWNIKIPGEQTKTGAPIEMPFPSVLLDTLTCYLERVRVLFPAARTSDHLWLCKFGVNRNPYWLHERITKLTARLTGRPINPHLFRSMGATLLAEDAPDDIFAAADLLTHKHRSTTERHYIRAKNLKASRRVGVLLDKARDRS
ncbi:site-specific integrase [Bosea sp. CS1GBMeth4]|uniref:site-specific integrase n=1 Tax=Bosea sp. CS1GBMeth4 TaxID=1892849 RepID=UPI001646C479|nr:site-specific integrase [Bosea sp. CS1GBMeth4]